VLPKTQRRRAAVAVLSILALGASSSAPALADVPVDANVDAATTVPSTLVPITPPTTGVSATTVAPATSAPVPTTSALVVAAPTTSAPATTTTTTTTSAPATTTTPATTSTIPAPVSGPDPCLTGCPVASQLHRQWYIEQVGSGNADATGEVVAVLDGGIDLEHRELVGRVRRATCAPVEATNLMHGTAIAGMLVAGANDATGLGPVVKGLTVVDIPVFEVVDFESSTNSAIVAEAVRCAVFEGATVINLSLSGSCSNDDELRTAIRQAIAAGVSVVAAAGNEPGGGSTCPAAYPGVIGVAATDIERATRTATTSADLAAPGFGVLTAGLHPLAPHIVISGSSFATPLVSAAVAVVAAKNPTWSPARIEAHLVAVADWSLINTGDDAVPFLRIDRIGRTAPGFLAVGTSGQFVAAGDAVSSLSSSNPEPDLMWTASCTGAWSVDDAGRLRTHGTARSFGDLTPFDLAAPVVAIAASPNSTGYWMVGADGGVFAFGGARFFGSMGGITLRAPIVGLTPTESGNGYWLVGSDGGIFAFGDASFYGTVTTSGVVGLRAWDGGYALIVRSGAITFPRLSFLKAPNGVTVVDALVARDTQIGADLWLLGDDGAFHSTSGRASVPVSPSTAALRATHTSDCSTE